MTHFVIDFLKAKEAWDLWIQSLRTGPRYRVPFLGPTHEGVLQFVASGLSLALLLCIAAAVVWSVRRR